MDGGFSGAVDGQPEGQKHADHPELPEGFQINPLKDKPGPFEGRRKFDPDAEFPRQSELGLMEKIEQAEDKLVQAAATAFARAAATTLVDMVAPGAGRVLHAVLEVQKVVKAVDAAFSDDPELKLSLPTPVDYLDVTVRIPLSDKNGAERREGSPVALAVTPDSSIVGWSLDASEQDDQSKHDDRRARVEEFTSGRQKVALVEVDLSRPRLRRSREDQARALTEVAAEYASRFRADPHLRRYDSFIVADKGRGCGVMVQLHRTTKTTR